jgi:hypothetical protein
MKRRLLLLVRDERPRAAKPTTRTRVLTRKVYRLGDLDAINSFTHTATVLVRGLRVTDLVRH